MGPAGMAQRYREWQDFYSSHSGCPGYCCDLDHHPESRGSAGGMSFPVQLTHGHILCFSGNQEEWQLATAKEHMCANGFHAVPSATPPEFPLCGLVPVLDSLGLEPRQLKELSGNGMNLATQSSWMLYVMANVERIDRTVVGESFRQDEW